MSQAGRDSENLGDLDALIEEITTGAGGDDGQLRAFQQAFGSRVTLPLDGFVIGEPVSVIEIDYGGNARHGLTVRCRRADGSEHVVAASDVVLPRTSLGARHLAAYRRWLGLDPYPSETSGPGRRKRRHKAAAEDIDLSRPVELIALSIKERAARCAVPGSERRITLRASRLWDVVPGEIVTVRPRKQWLYAGHPYLSGEIESSRLDVSALGLVPLGLEDKGTWDPREHSWDEEDAWAAPTIARGPRPAFEMEQVLPGTDPDDPLADPIDDSNDLEDAGDHRAAYRILMELCEADLRCLDSHAHLGNFAFDHRPAEAIRHYEVGVRIGELSLGARFEGVLPWGWVNNRPFLRCVHGHGLCLWRLERRDDAERVFERMLSLNPLDNQGARFLLSDLRAGKAWNAS